MSKIHGIIDPSLMPAAAQPIGLSRRGFLRLALATGAVTAASMALPGCSNDEMYMLQETYKVAPLTISITARAGSTREAVELVVQWAQKNFFHYYCSSPDENWCADIYTKDESRGGLRTISIEEIFRERAVGCHFASGVVITMLRSIDIYAEYVREKNGKFVDSGGHGVCYIPELNRYIHGDYIAELVAIPAHKLLQTKDELQAWSAHPGFVSELSGNYVFQGFYAYMAVLNEQCGFTRDGIRKRRRGNALSLFGFLSAEMVELGLNYLVELCPEFVLRLGEEDPYGRIPFTSEDVPIQPLTW